MLSDETDDAVASAQRLLAYAATRGIDVDPKIVRTVLDFASAQDKPPNVVAQQKFWGSYAILSKLLNPVTSRSLSEVASESAKRQQTKAIYLVKLALVLVISITAYFAVGRYIASTLPDEMEAICKIIPSICTDVNATVPEGALGEAVHRPIDRLYVKWSILSYLTLHIYEYHQNSTGLYLKAPGAFYIAKNDIEKLQYEWNLLDRIVSTTLLPVLYAWFGVWTYLLRQVSRCIGSSTWTPELEMQSNPRIAMALLSGFLIGLFNDFQIKISPLALAFIVGYSVEVFFSLLDSVTSGLKGSDERNSPAP